MMDVSGPYACICTSFGAQDSEYVGDVPGGVYGYAQDAPAIGGYVYGLSSTNSADTLPMVLLMVMISFLFFVLCVVSNIVVGATCFVVGKELYAKKEAVDDEPALDV